MAISLLNHYLYSKIEIHIWWWKIHDRYNSFLYKIFNEKRMNSRKLKIVKMKIFHQVCYATNINRDSTCTIRRNKSNLRLTVKETIPFSMQVCIVMTCVWRRGCATWVCLFLRKQSRSRPATRDEGSRVIVYYCELIIARFLVILFSHSHLVPR